MRQMHAGLSFEDYDIETLNHQDDHAAHGDVRIDNVAEDEVRDVLEHIILSQVIPLCATICLARGLSGIVEIRFPFLL